MFSTFTTEHGTLAVPTQRIVSIADGPNGCALTWQATSDDLSQRLIEGTAAENLARITQEETNRVLQAQARQAQGLPMPPVPRGRR